MALGREDRCKLVGLDRFMQVSNVFFDSCFSDISIVPPSAVSQTSSAVRLTSSSASSLSSSVGPLSSTVVPPPSADETSIPAYSGR